MKTLKSPLLSSFSEITHAFTSRHGGLSKAPFHSNNLAFHVGDLKTDVIQNHQKTAKSLGYEYQNLIHMRQIHSDKITIVDSKRHHFENPPECDALITNQTATPLMVMTADCTPVLLYDPIQKVIAVAHAGRAGALKSIVTKTIKKMSASYDSDIENILVALGPSIGVCCYEVGTEIAQETDILGYGFAVEHRAGSYFLDVNAIILHQLKTLGLKEVQINNLSVCNACHNSTYFSYRADQKETGRFGGILMINP